jgi:hypothetical protein
MAKHCFVMACQTKSYYYYCKTVLVEDLTFLGIHLKLDYHKVPQNSVTFCLGNLRHVFFSNTQEKEPQIVKLQKDRIFGGVALTIIELSWTNFST